MTKAEESILDNLFRKLIIARDGHCIICMGKINLKAYRLYSEIVFPALRWDPVNGITLCNDHADSMKKDINAIKSAIGACRLDCLKNHSQHLKPYMDFGYIKECLKEAIAAFGGKL